jgi:hypothetical protein
MTPEELAAKLESTIIAANEILGTGIKSVQNSLYPQIVKVLKDLELDEEGLILQNAGNRAIINKSLTVLDQKVASSQYQNLIENYLKTIPAVDALSVTYFEALSDAFKPNRQFLASLQKQTVKQVEDLLFNQGFEASVKIPLSNVLNTSINSGGHFTDLLDSVRTFIKGTTDIDGKLLSHTKTITKSILFNYSRAFHHAVSNDLGLVWYAYSGGLMRSSRDFCIDKAGHYYLKSEIETWPDQDWAGKVSGTNASTIFIFAGGWNCSHSIIPVHESTVPEEDIISSKERGFVS